MTQPWIIVVWTTLSLLFLGVGVRILGVGRDFRKKHQRIAEAETTNAGSVEPGTVELEGTARPGEDGETVRAPFSRERALVADAAVKTYTGGEGSNWRTIHEETRTVPFVVDDGTGQARVDPPGEKALDLDIDLARERVTVGRSEQPPERIRRYLERDDGIDFAGEGLLGEKRQYQQSTIVPGDEVYVLGQAVEVDGEWDETSVEVTGGDRPEEFVLSDKSEEDVEQNARLAGLVLYFFGGIFAATGFLFLGIGLVAFLPW